MGKSASFRIGPLAAFLAAGMLLGVAAWRCLRADVEGAVLREFTVRAGTAPLEPVDRRLDEGLTPLHRLQPGHSRALLGLDPGSYRVDVEYVVGSAQAGAAAPIALLTSRGAAVPQQTRLRRVLEDGAAQRVTRFLARVGEDRTLTVRVAEDAVPVELVRVDPRNYGPYERATAFLVYCDQERARSPWPPWLGALMVLAGSAAFALAGYDGTRRGLWARPLRAGVLAAAGPGLLLAAEGLLLLATEYRLLLTPLGLAVAGIGPAAAAWLVAELRRGREAASPSALDPVLVWAVLGLALLTVGLHAADPSPATFWSDEVIYADVARSMLRGGAALELYDESAPFFHKPPFGVIWPTVLFSHIAGLSAVTLRLGAWLYACGIVSLCYVIGRRAAGPAGGLAAAGVLLSTRFFQIYANAGMHETALAFWELAAVLALVLPERPGGRSAMLAGACAGLALLSKGMAGLPVVLWLVAWFALALAWGRARGLHAVLAAAALLVVALPWHVYALARFGEAFASEYWGYHVWGRIVRTVERQGGDWLFYVDRLREWAWPYVWLYLPAMVVVLVDRRLRKSVGPLLGFGLLVLLLFTAARTKLAPYVFPAVPVFSVTVGCALVRVLPRPVHVLLLALPLAGVFLSADVAQTKAGHARYPDKEMVKALDRGWPVEVPVLLSTRWRSEAMTFMTGREIRRAAFDDLCAACPAAASAPVLVRARDYGEWVEPLYQAGFRKVFGNELGTLFVLEPAHRLSVCTTRAPQYFVDLAWHPDWPCPLALRADGGLFACDETRAATLCVLLPGANPQFPPVRLIALDGERAAVLEETGRLSLLRVDAAAETPRVVLEARESPWPHFLASGHARAMDFRIEADGTRLLLVGDGHVWQGRHDPRRHFRYPDYGLALSLLRVDAAAPWLVASQFGSVAPYPGEAPGALALLRRYRGPIGQHLVALVQAAVLPDGRTVCLVNRHGGVQLRGPGRWRVERPAPMAECAGFVVRETDGGAQLLLLDDPGNLYRAVLRREDS